MEITWHSGMSAGIDGIRQYVFKRAKQLQTGDRMEVQVDGKWEVSTVFNVGETHDERGKPVKAQHMGTGNVAKGVFVIYEDGGESLLHPDEQVKVLR